jgi:hypothetical protein
LAEIPIDSLSVELSGQIEPRSGQPGFEDVPRHPHAIAYTVWLESPASDEQLRALHQRVALARCFASCSPAHPVNDATAR